MKLAALASAAVIGAGSSGVPAKSPEHAWHCQPFATQVIPDNGHYYNLEPLKGVNRDFYSLRNFGKLLMLGQFDMSTKHPRLIRAEADKGPVDANYGFAEPGEEILISIRTKPVRAIFALCKDILVA